MAIFNKPEASGGSFRLFKDEIGDQVCPEGQHVAKCIDIKEEYGVDVQKFQSEETEKQDRIAFLFEVNAEDGRTYPVLDTIVPLPKAMAAMMLAVSGQVKEQPSSTPAGKFAKTAKPVAPVEEDQVPF
jgi:hypothetical protein